MIRQLKIEPAVTEIKLPLSNESLGHAEIFYNRHFPDKSKKVLGFHPGAGKEANVWPPERFAELAFRLSNMRSAYILISEGPSDEKYVGQMKNILIENFNVHEIAVHKGELMYDAAVIDKADLFVTNDTGIMHISSGLKPPVIALFGETNAYEWGPLGEKKISIQSPDEKMSGISVETAIETCVSVLTQF